MRYEKHWASCSNILLHSFSIFTETGIALTVMTSFMMICSGEAVQPTAKPWESRHY